MRPRHETLRLGSEKTGVWTRCQVCVEGPGAEGCWLNRTQSREPVNPCFCFFMEIFYQISVFST